MACFRRCYGDTYPSDDFYDADRLRLRIESGSLRSVVAMADDGTLVGHTGLTVRHPGANAIEAGNTVVDPASRGQGLLARLGAALTDLCTGEGYVAYLHYPTTAHEIMQKGSVRTGIETGVMLDYIPAETDYREIDQGVGRLAATVVYQPFTPAPARDVWVAQGYFDLVADRYRRASIERRLQVADSAPEGRTEAATTFSAKRSLIGIYVTAIGNDFDHVIAAALSDRSHAIAHVDMCMDDCGIGAAVRVLHRRGFFFCALMPEFAHTDVLRMQRLTIPASTSFAPRLANPDAVRLLELMRREHTPSGI